MNDTKTTDLRADYLDAKRALDSKRAALASTIASQTPRGAIAHAALKVAVGEAEEAFFSAERALAGQLDEEDGVEDADLAARLEGVRVEIAAKLEDVRHLEIAAAQLVAGEAARRDAVNLARRAAGDPRVRRPIDPTVLGGWREAETSLRAPLPRKVSVTLAADRAALREAQLAVVREEREAARVREQYAERDRGEASRARASAESAAAATDASRAAAAKRRAEDDATIAALGLA